MRKRLNNNWQATGRIGKEVVVGVSNNGDSVFNNSLAIDESFTDSDGNRQERTTWIKIEVWKKLAEMCGKYLKKGDLVEFSGRPKAHGWGDKGEAELIMVADEFALRAHSNKTGDAENTTGEIAYSGVSDTDIPFD